MTHLRIPDLIPMLQPERIITGHSAAIYSVVPGRSAHAVFSASGDKYVAEWDTNTGSQLPFAVKLEHPAYSVCYIPGDELLCVGNSVGGIHVIDLNEKREVRYLLQHSNGIYDLAWDESRAQLLAAGGDGVLSAWSVPDFNLLIALPVITEKLRQIRFSPDYSTFVLACGDGRIRLMDPVFFNEQSFESVHPDGATSAVFHPLKQAVLSGGKDAMLRVHALAGGHELLAIPAHNYAIYSIAFSPDGLLFATASRDKSIKLWDALTLDPIDRLEARNGGHSHSVNKIFWQDQNHLISCSDDRKILVIRAGKEPAENPE